ncbi:hypothetical protein YC2023_123789 [Brassica napus]
MRVPGCTHELNNSTQQNSNLGGDWFSRYHPQTQLLRSVAVVGESHKFKSWLQLAFAVAGGCGRAHLSRDLVTAGPKNISSPGPPSSGQPAADDCNFFSPTISDTGVPNTQLETQRDRDGGSKTGNSPFQFAAQSRLDLEKEGHREKYYQSTHHDESGHTYHRRQSNRSGHQGARIGQREGYTRSSSYRTHHSTDRNRNPKPHSEQDRSRYETNLQWRPRTEPSIRFSKEPSQPNAVFRADEASSSPLALSTLVRGVPLRSDLPLNTQAALEEALGEVREVMNQYTMCADPTESAVRKERLRQAEEQGQLEETAHMMVAALQAQGPLAPEEPSPSSNERVSALQRLGPQSLTDITDLAEASTDPITTKRKPGRPPGKKTGNSSPQIIAGPSNKKRRTTSTKPPLSRRKLATESSQLNRATKMSTARSGSSRTSSGNGSMGWPFIGETISFFKPHRSDSIGTFLQQHVSRYGKVFKSNICGGKAIVSCEQELNMFILQNEGKLFTSDYPKAMHDILGEYSLLLVTGEVHRKLKNVIISFINLTKSKPEFLLCAENLSISMLASWKNCREIEFHNEAKMFTLSVMVNQLLSIKPEDPARRYVLQDFLSYMKGFISLPVPLPGTAYTDAIKARKRLSARVMEMIKSRENKEEEMNKALREEDFLDVIMSNEDLNYKEKVSIVLDILLGGFETSATLLSLVVYFLAKSPSLLQKLKEEHEAIRAKKGDGELLNWEDYQKMEFTQCAMSEALRCGNIVKTVHRKATHDIKFKEYVIPKGWKVFPIFTAVHLDPSLHENPFEFNPMRWTDKAKMNRKTTAFGGGVRVCPGGELGKLQIAFFLHHLVLSYRWQTKSDEMPIAHPYVEFKRGMLLEIDPTS